MKLLIGKRGGVASVVTVVIACGCALAALAKHITGVVTDEADAPIPNAIVELLSVARNGNTNILLRTESDHEGRFKLEGQFSGTLKIKLSARGFVPALVSINNSDMVDVGKIRMKISCSGPGVVCDEVTPKAQRPSSRK